MWKSVNMQILWLLLKKQGMGGVITHSLLFNIA